MPVVPGVYAVAGVFLMVVLHGLAPISYVRGFPFFGMALVLLSGVLGVWSAMLFARHKTTIVPDGNPSFLVTGGPYVVSRNPMYLSLGLFLLGIAVMLGSLSSMLVPLLFIVLMDRMFVRKEERILEQAFPERFGEYRERTRRWL